MYNFTPHIALKVFVSVDRWGSCLKTDSQGGRTSESVRWCGCPGTPKSGPCLPVTLDNCLSVILVVKTAGHWPCQEQ